MNKISIKGLVFSGVGYFTVVFILSLLMLPGIFTMLNTDCSVDLYSNQCLTFINSGFGAMFLVSLALTSIATYISIGILANYSLPNLKVNYFIYLIINITILILYFSEQPVLELLIESIIMISIVIFSYYTETANYNKATVPNTSESA